MGSVRNEVATGAALLVERREVWAGRAGVGDQHCVGRQCVLQIGDDALWQNRHRVRLRQFLEGLELLLARGGDDVARGLFALARRHFLDRGDERRER